MEALRTQVGRDAQMAFVVLSNNKKDRYDALKKWLCIDAPGMIVSFIVLTAMWLVLGYGSFSGQGRCVSFELDC